MSKNIIGQDYDIASHTTHVRCVTFMHEGWTYYSYSADGFPKRYSNISVVLLYVILSLRWFSYESYVIINSFHTNIVLVDFIGAITFGC